MDTRKELTNKFRADYRRASKIGKSIILDEFTSRFGYSRKYAISLIGSDSYVNVTKKKHIIRHRKSKYDSSVREVLIKIWLLSGMMNAKALHAGMKLWLDRLIFFDDIEVDDDTYNQLLTMGSSTIGRITKPIRDKLQLKGISSTTRTKDNTLKQSIPIRKSTDEVDKVPGYMEIDTVANCGNTQKGEFIRTITMTDILTGFTATVSIRNNAHQHILSGLNYLKSRIPFDIIDIHSDNGSEFINQYVAYWTMNEGITTTRSRPYKKNDNPRVEKRNLDIVRKKTFYYRYDTEEELNLLNELHALLYILYNFFTPSEKTIGYTYTKLGKRKTVRDTFATPYERVKITGILSRDKEKELETLFISTNPADITRNINKIQNKLTKLARNKPESQNYMGNEVY